MVYTINLSIAQKTRDKFDIVEKTCWHYANGGNWTIRGDDHVLTMGGSGTSGILRFRSRSGEVFCVAMGVHNYKRWCDLVVDLTGNDTAKAIHPTYYVPGGGPKLWAQLSRITKTTERGTKLTLEFSVKEGEQLRAHLTISKPLRLLSLDGGGIRGLSALIVLGMIMKKLNAEQASSKGSARRHLKPCDVFDLICGTGTGGLIAIMLGRLRMDIDECVDKYVKLMKKIWGSPAPVGPGAVARFDSGLLGEAMTGLIGADSDGPFCTADDDGCKVLVCAKAFETNKVVRLRSYTIPAEINFHPAATVTNVAQATCASSGFFTPVKFGNRQYVDGGLGLSNPVDEMWREADLIWCTDYEDRLDTMVQCVLSIGTGNTGLHQIDDNLAKTTAQIALQTEETAREFMERNRRLLYGHQYCRFDVKYGLQDVGLNECKMQPTVEAATEYYLNAQDQRFHLRDCARSLLDLEIGR